jgi:hypothetical protein
MHVTMDRALIAITNLIQNNNEESNENAIQILKNKFGEKYVVGTDLIELFVGRLRRKRI